MLDIEIKRLIELNKTIAIMDCATFGKFTNYVSNIEGFEKILCFSCIPLNDKDKVKFGVREATLINNTAYSIEAVQEMARCISNFSNSDFGIACIGNISKELIYDPRSGQDTVYVAIYRRSSNQIFVSTINLVNAEYEQKKDDIVMFIADQLKSLI